MKQYPVSEMFGPTIQGEGPLIGTQTLFLRFAGCDSDCGWCDTKYAVLPRYPGWKRTMMTAEEICSALVSLPACEQVTLSGGNPALFVDFELLGSLMDHGFYATMETQGTKVLPPFALTHPALRYLVISPKPPSSGMSDTMNPGAVGSMITFRRSYHMKTLLKYVVFTEDDLQWIEQFDKSIEYEPWEKSISIGTTIDATLGHDELVLAVLQDTRRWTERILRYDYFKDFRILPQLHTLIWGRKRGV